MLNWRAMSTLFLEISKLDRPFLFVTIFSNAWRSPVSILIYIVATHSRMTLGYLVTDERVLPAL